MRNRLASVALCLFLSMSVAAQKKKTDREHEGLIGPVRRVKVEVTSLSSQSGQMTEGKLVKLREAIFGADGMLREETTRDGPTGMPINHFYTYNKQGERREDFYYGGPPRNSASYDDPVFYLQPFIPRNLDGSLSIYWKFRYDTNGNRVEEAVSWSQRTAYKNVYTYGADGKATEMLRYAGDARLMRKYVFTYDEKGNVREMSAYDRDDKLIGKESYSYELDSTGNWVKRTTSLWNRQKSAYEPKQITYRTITY